MKELKNLLKVKSILSILFSVTTCYMALKGKINENTKKLMKKMLRQYLKKLLKFNLENYVINKVGETPLFIFK